MNIKEYTPRTSWLVGHAGKWGTSSSILVWLDKSPGFKVLFNMDDFSLLECLLKAFRGGDQNGSVRVYKMPGWMKHKLESRLQGEISITWGMQMTPPLWQKARGNNEPLHEHERQEWKNWLKTQHSKMKFMASRPITSWQINGEAMETVTDFFFLGSKITADGDCSHEIERYLEASFGRKSLEGKLWPT